MRPTPEELATILASLRLYQFAKRYRLCVDVEDVATDGGTLKALTAEDIDKLCLRMNLAPATSPYLNKPCLTERERNLVDALKASEGALTSARDFFTAHDLHRRADGISGVIDQTRAFIAEIEATQ